tara:strand:+ start:608 stop:1075 length:468 start_codon:yes stop_codon:yes gene_type:complete
MWKVIILLTIPFLIRAIPKREPIFSGTYLALKCGLNRHISAQDTFIFDSKNGYLYYFDLAEDEFKPLNQRINEGIYFYTMEEIDSRLEVNKLIGNKLLITYIDYLNQESSQKSIIKKSINLRWLLMYTVYKKGEEKLSSRRDNCIWIDPKQKTNT